MLVLEDHVSRLLNFAWRYIWFVYIYLPSGRIASKFQCAQVCAVMPHWVFRWWVHWFKSRLRNMKV